MTLAVDPRRSHEYDVITLLSNPRILTRSPTGRANDLPLVFHPSKTRSDPTGSRGLSASLRNMRPGEGIGKTRTRAEKALRMIPAVRAIATASIYFCVRNLASAIQESGFDSNDMLAITTLISQLGVCSVLGTAHLTMLDVLFGSRLATVVPPLQSHLWLKPTLALIWVAASTLGMILLGIACLGFPPLIPFVYAFRRRRCR